MGQTGGIPAPRLELPPMEPMPTLDRDAYIAALRRTMEAVLGQVADAINAAPDGHIISGSERQVFDLFATLKHDAFQAGLQMRTDAADAAFSPSAGRRDRQAAAE